IPVSQHSHARSSCTRRKSSWTSSSLRNSSIVCSRTSNCTKSNGNKTHCAASNRSENSNSSNTCSSCRSRHAHSSCSRTSTDYASARCLAPVVSWGYAAAFPRAHTAIGADRSPSQTASLREQGGGMPMATSTDALAPDLRERVLSRLGLSAPPRPDLQGLTTVYAAWCRQVPFDNIRKLIHVQTQNQGVLPGDSAQDFFEAWLTDNTRGTS